MSRVPIPIILLLLLAPSWAYTDWKFYDSATASRSNRRKIIRKGIAVFSPVVAPWLIDLAKPPLAFAAKSDKDVQTLQQTSIDLKSCTSQADLFFRGLISEETLPDAPMLPAQISLRIFQSLAPLARNVPALNFEAEDFLGVAAEYAEHAGSARDYVKLAKLGRIGENGSEDLAVFYAKKAVEEVKETEKALQVLVQAVQQ
eukprot:CAMPEP_0113303658 /NCGR_PEP_ID=MMETSP0010_2-20120614/3984_1 /TAXON_ID=216773 ORGANISM="Corethron hystrix, Strain 308" /NCGR_SAMPLE_ID=MMETSP0010_2 /ASSEMBLY_ACC=CAM_ASM_000155 /LENGTH=200 /DNA_ID=CAMNT_0000157695 /DNA_START=64 /DNA_END=666 /DNA_ORIENTATION=- /assembly_acc=CAM_ASM_000155